jgi:acetolactate synthase-1/2/3 large subunit
VLDKTKAVLDDPKRLDIALNGDPTSAAQRLVEMAGRMQWPSSSWRDEVQDAVSYRPAEWRELESPPEGPLHAVEVSRVVQQFLDSDPHSVFISDGGEFGQWVQSCVSSPRRVINGPGGNIGTSIPFAMAASLAYPDSRVVTLLGDGTFGFHGMEIDTAVRHNIPFIAVVGNDAMWNAEYQIQLREYGPERALGCELLLSRYDQLAQALGGHGENVTKPAELAPALERSLASGLPACVNVAVQRTPAPVVRRTAAQQARAGAGH